MSPELRPQAVVIFGASGDLTKRKLLPAFWSLFVQGLLPKGFAITGYARTEMTDDEFREQARESVKLYGRRTPDDEAWREFAERLSYLPGEFANEGAMNAAGEASRLGRRAVRHRRGAVLLRRHADHRLPRHRAAPGRGRAAPGRQDRLREAVRRRPGLGPGAERQRSTRSSTSPRSSGSTTTWARRPSRTSWPSGSPTGCSSRCGTDSTSTTSSSPWPRTSGSRAGEPSTSRPGPSATSS